MFQAIRLWYSCLGRAFADASQEHGYGTASYLRIIDQGKIHYSFKDQGKIHYSFVMGKSHLRPLKNAVTVPRLELTAATLATLVIYAITKVR